jgi:hypothetical protein
MVDDTQKHQTTFPNQGRMAAQAQLSGAFGTNSLQPPSNPWQSAEGYNLPTNVEKEFNKFQVRANEPVARDIENWVFDYRRNEGLYPMNIDSVPIPGGGWKVSDRNLRKIQPIINAGITNPNLGGYKVMNADSDKVYMDKIIRDNPEAIYDWYEWNRPMSEEEMEWFEAPIDRYSLPYGGPSIDMFIDANPSATNEDLWNFLESLPPGLDPGGWYDFGDGDMGASI